MSKNIVVVLVIAIVIVGVSCFYGGMVFAKSSNKGLAGRNFNGQQFGANIAGMGQRGDRVGGAGAVGGFVSGEVISQDGQSITVKLKDTGTKIVFFSNSTQVMKTAAGSTSDIAVGSNLTITGKANADGSITAQSIQIRPSVPVK